MEEEYYRLPKVFFEDNTLKTLKANSKVLYSVLLSRAGLSSKNRFFDNKGVYVYRSQEELANDIKVERRSLRPLLKELEQHNLLSLYSSNKIGKTSQMYVRKFQDNVGEYFQPSDFENLKFKHIRIQKSLFTDNRYSHLTNKARIAYSLLLDRKKLSIQKGNFVDSNGNVYVIYPQSELQEQLCCSLRTVISILSELSNCGLIYRQKQYSGSPDIIYVSDMGVQKCDTDVQKSDTDMKKSDMGMQKTDMDMQKCDTDMQKSDTLLYKYTDYRDTDYKNTDFSYINPVSDTATASEEAEIIEKNQNDRLIDNSNNNKAFAEILTAIGSIYGIGYHTNIENESYFEEYSEDDRNTNRCSIPYGLKYDKNGMIQALKFLFAYSYRIKDMNENEQNLLDSIIEIITELATHDMTKVSKRYVKYCEIIDIINNIVKNSSLIDWYGLGSIDGFKQHWEDVLVKKQQKGEIISNPSAFLKSCIANYLLDYKVYETMDEITANGLSRGYFGVPISAESKAESKFEDEYELLKKEFPQDFQESDFINLAEANPADCIEKYVSAYPISSSYRDFLKKYLELFKRKPEGFDLDGYRAFMKGI